MITISYDFTNRRPEELAQINAILATMRLEELQLEDHKGYLATSRDAEGNLLCQRYGLDSGRLICKLAENGDGYIYQIDTVVTDPSVEQDEFLDIWRNNHQDRVLRIVISVEYQNALAYMMIHHKTKA